eukprot:343743_1
MEVERQSRPSLAPIAGLASAIAMGVVIGYGLSRPSAFSSAPSSSSANTSRQQQNRNGSSMNRNINQQNASSIIRYRILKTYGYFAGSIGITGLSAFYFYNHTKYSQNALLRMSKHPNWYLFTSLLSSVVLLFAT